MRTAATVLRRAPCLFLPLLAVALATPAARADDVKPVVHLAYGAGGAFAGESGFRESFDAGGAVAFTHSSGHGMFGSPGDGWLVGASVITGFGKYPTYLTAEGGGLSAFFFSLMWTAGPALRVDPDVGVGLQASASLYLAILQIGVRAVGIATNGSEVQLEGVIGVGWPGL